MAFFPMLTGTGYSDRLAADRRKSDQMSRTDSALLRQTVDLVESTAEAIDG